IQREPGEIKLWEVPLTEQPLFLRGWLLLAVEAEIEVDEHHQGAVAACHPLVSHPQERTVDPERLNGGRFPRVAPALRASNQGKVLVFPQVLQPRIKVLGRPRGSPPELVRDSLEHLGILQSEDLVVRRDWAVDQTGTNLGHRFLRVPRGGASRQAVCKNEIKGAPPW